ncbi:hypothetical protein M409DRAFT_59650 [Zasmidium cellare ATCC 36951]|uniref:Major facilitator superfamily (MFS) profile domain-containing protein n=1 Tax=Zasmidium cellare ATCC 36951 TaxID=1080233 RepID=A0A6A6C660_ZASCE|nr:uncharacterized protein M409DRAFT_59650 [Zasmidium cellare ATCC 36951]KAF2160866.1 hypothetical protein M409DRAFT_59650 [Zasmidium cellare ATCC 36951]
MASNEEKDPAAMSEATASKDSNNASTSELDDEHNISRGSLTLLTTCICLAVLLLSLDRTIVAVAIPHITNTFHSFPSIGWYASAYLLTLTALQPLFGRLCTLLPTKPIYLSAFATFLLGSLICALAPTSPALIVGRAIARTRPAWIAGVSLWYSLGAIVAPLVGGALTEKVSWRWCFWLNLPVGGPVVLGMAVLFRPPKQRERGGKSVLSKISSLDILGVVLLLGAATMLFYALQRAADGTPWNNSLIIGLLIGSIITTLLFAAWQAHQGSNALITPRLLKQRTILSAGIANIAMYAALTAYIYFLPLYFQALKGASVVGSAVDLLPLVVACSVFSIVAGVLVTKIGYFTPPAVFGLSLTIIGAGLMTTINENTSTAHWAGYQILLGTGLGLALQSGFFGVQAVLPPNDIPMGTSLMAFCQSLGGALGVSVGNAVLLDVLRGHGEELLTKDVDVESVIAAGATAFRSFVHGEGLHALLGAYSQALRQVFVMAAGFVGGALLSACAMEVRKATERVSTSTISAVEETAPKP